MSMKYSIYEIHYHTNGNLESVAIVAAKSGNDAENSLRSKCLLNYNKSTRKGIEEFFLKIRKNSATGFNSDKEGIIYQD